MLISRPGPHPQISVCQTLQLVLLCQALKIFTRVINVCGLRKVCFEDVIFSSNLLLVECIVHTYCVSTYTAGEALQSRLFQEQGRRLRSRNSLELEQRTALGKSTQSYAQIVLQMPCVWRTLDTCFYLYLFFFPSPVKSQTFEHRLFLPGSLPRNSWVSPSSVFLSTTFSST